MFHCSGCGAELSLLSQSCPNCGKAIAEWCEGCWYKTTSSLMRAPCPHCGGNAWTKLNPDPMQNAFVIWGFITGIGALILGLMGLLPVIAFGAAVFTGEFKSEYLGLAIGMVLMTGVSLWWAVFCLRYVWRQIRKDNAATKKWGANWR